MYTCIYICPCIHLCSGNSLGLKGQSEVGRQVQHQNPLKPRGLCAASAVPVRSGRLHIQAMVKTPYKPIDTAHFGLFRIAG